MYFNYPPPLSTIIFTKAIYILSSITGQIMINEYTAEQLVNGRERLSIDHNEMHQVVSVDINREQGLFRRQISRANKL